MARLPYVDPAIATDAVQQVFARLPAPLNVFKMLANAPTLLRPAVQLGTAILSRTELDPALRELVILRVARLSGSTYEWGQHTVIGKLVGVTDDQIAALERDTLDAPCFPPPTRCALVLTTEVVQNVRASEATFQTAVENFGARAVVELIMTAGYYRMLAGMLESCAVEWDTAIGAALLGKAR
jgi:4-carboxymuconolactone decarboxylase